MKNLLPSIEDLFFAASERQDPGARGAYLDEACGRDTDLRRRVEELLAAEPKVSQFLESPAIGFVPMAGEESPCTVIGPYKLLERIGEGGMGVVYVAEQTQPMRRKVALKIIKPGMDTKQVIARFEAERQTLAMMDHPNIAKVHDAGATESGRPYFVMELVRGIPITEYCDREKLSIPERLELFVLVCRAAQHAHQKGIIHRDLKPSNILVAVIDGAAMPKIIDFGVAKATGSSLTERTLFTAFDQFIGTPLYMSPEQAELFGVDVDTRSDIYSLGVLLYELLTGTTPFDAQTFRTAPFDEIRRIIREQEPPRPSTRLSGLGARLTTVSNQRRSDSRKLVDSVRGELDWVVMKCLEKDRTRRYETAYGLARDLMRYLADQPVEACPPSLRYRFTKYARRNRALLAMATVVSLALIAGTTISTWQAIRATGAETRMAAALVEARNQSRLAQEHSRLAERHLYASLLRQARQAIDLGQVEQAQEILEEIEAGPDGHDPRDFAWHYLSRLARREIIPLRADDRRFVDFALSPDGRTIATTDSDFRIQLWDLATHRRRADLTGMDFHAFQPSFSSDGRRLVAIEADRPTAELKHGLGAVVWDTTTGRLLTRLPTRRRGETLLLAEFVRGHPLVLLQSSLRGGDAVTTLWSLAPDPARPRQVGVYPTRNLARWVPGPNLIMKEGDRLQLLDPEPGAARVELAGAYERDVGPWAWSEDGRVVAAAVADRRVVLWDANTGRELDRYSTDAGPFLQILFAPDGIRVAARDDTTGRIHLWDRSSRRSLTMQVVEAGRSQLDMTIAFSRDSRCLAVSCWGTPGGAPRVALWDVVTGQRVRVCPARPLSDGEGRLAFTPDDHFLVLSGSPAIRLWRLDPDRPIELAGHADEAWAVAFSPEGRILASGSDDTEDDDMIKLWDPGTGQLLRGWRTGEGTISALAFSSDGQTLASAALCPSQNLRLWDVATGRLLTTLEGHTDRVRSVAFSPDGTRLASAGSDRTIRLWDGHSGRPLLTLSGHSDTVRKVAFSPDGHTLASASNDRSVRLWSVNTGKVIRELRTLQKCSAVAFAPDGALLASADEGGDITLWDPTTGDRKSTIHSDHDQLFTLAFSPDGCALAAAGSSRIIRIWDVLTSQELLALPGHAAQINAVAFSPDGRTLASCSHDGAVRLWHSEEPRSSP
jgi:WD40 repeat protein/serine/threonine protein kinase